MKSMDAYDSTVKLSYEHKFDMPGEMNNKEKSDIIKGGIIRMCERVAASGGTPTPYSA